MSKKKSPPAPPTVLVITLEQDGTGSLLARRGELAHLSQFTYSGLSEIVAAIQQGATELIAVEQTPPPLDVTSAPSEVPPEVDPDTEQESVETSDADDGSPTKQSIVNASSASIPLVSVTAKSPDLQPKLL